MVLLLGGVGAGGCVQRTLSITSEPPGAVVTVNNREIGRTPLKTDFEQYGWYDVQLRREGYETLKVSQPLHAPWWGYPPFDLLAEAMPWHPKDRRALHYKLSPTTEREASPASMLERAASLRSRLESPRK
jgi:hypothetical protein